METAEEIGRLKLDEIKIHPLHVIKETKLETQGGYWPLELEEYVDLASKFLEYLFLSTVIQRISVNCPVLQSG